MQVGARFVDIDRTKTRRKPVECVVTAVPTSTETSIETEKKKSNQVYWAKPLIGKGGEERPYIWDKEKGRLVRAGNRVGCRAKYPRRRIGLHRLIERDRLALRLDRHWEDYTLEQVTQRFHDRAESNEEYWAGAVSAYAYLLLHTPYSHRPAPQLDPGTTATGRADSGSAQGRGPGPA